MRFTLSVILLLLSSALYSQYFFNDIVSTQSANEQYRLLRANKVKKIKATSYEADNSVSDGFLLEEEISPDGKKTTLTSAVAGTTPSTTSRTYELSKLRRTQSFNKGIENKTEYTYNDKGLVQKIVLTTADTAMKYASIETHEWQYDDKGQPVSMLKIKNHDDTVLVELVKDDRGMVTEERWKKKNRMLENYYYYYDNSNRLTDIVRYNARLKKLIPDFQYEYDAASRISQMTQISLSTSNYVIWKYTYDDKGLKTAETGFDKQKNQVGRIQYTYEL